MATDLIDVRPGRAGDAEVISAVHDEAWRNAYAGILPALSLEKILSKRGPAYWHRLASRRSDTLSVLVFAGEVAGYATHGPSRVPRLPYRGEIYELYLRPTHQGLGLGRRLFGRVRAINEDRGLKGTIIWALADNSPACGFYKRLGGATVARAYESFADRRLEKLAFGWA
ncbi:GNAT family N-acetyltransferase [Lutibaculum baratangense]|uniref:GCN5-related N-acetyltransferase n=1 Tax=Lutibaculum baratangense AMV1 TaxID=631454 RepID=V4RIU7_9HYPH|nr:GNAT family N-acetyltransferase [Lutibaculum baratangense]ESR26011.1 GCN5-related N-acetyltransferase [Lutibaculum baratangense AMV1]